MATILSALALALGAALGALFATIAIAARRDARATYLEGYKDGVTTTIDAFNEALGVMVQMPIPPTEIVPKGVVLDKDLL